jgi:hypothetical protein
MKPPTRIIAPGTLLFGLWLAVAAAVIACGDDAQQADAGLTSNAVLAGQQDLTGSWVLNLEASDLPPRDRDGIHDRRRDQTGDGQGGPGMDGRRHREGDGPPPPDGRRGGPPFPEAFEVTQDESSITFTAPGGQSITYLTDGSTETRELPRGGRLEITASWDGELLVVERNVADRVSTTRAFGLSEDGTQLRVAVTVDGERLPEPIDLVLVYDRA